MSSRLLAWTLGWRERGASCPNSVPPSSLGTLQPGDPATETRTQLDTGAEEGEGRLGGQERRTRERRWQRGRELREAGGKERSVRLSGDTEKAGGSGRKRN